MKTRKCQVLSLISTQVNPACGQINVAQFHCGLLFFSEEIPTKIEKYIPKKIEILNHACVLIFSGTIMEKIRTVFQVKLKVS